MLQQLLWNFIFSKVADLSQLLTKEFYKITQSSCSIEHLWKTALKGCPINLYIVGFFCRKYLKETKTGITLICSDKISTIYVQLLKQDHHN